MITNSTFKIEFYKLLSSKFIKPKSKIGVNLPIIIVPVESVLTANIS